MRFFRVFVSGWLVCDFCVFGARIRESVSRPAFASQPVPTNNWYLKAVKSIQLSALVGVVVL